jgi:glycosyltransferase involved in cell wall biosynthesis
VKVLFLVRQLNIGGAERQLVIVANELASRGHEVIITSFYTGGALSKQLDLGRVRLLSLEKRSRWDLFSMYVKVLQIMRQERPDILHGWMHTQNVIATTIRLFYPGVKLFWCVRASNVENVLDPVESVLVWLQARLSTFADRIVVNSMAGLEHAASRGAARDKMVFIPNGIDTNAFYPSEKEGKRVRTEWGIGEGLKVIGKVARFDPIKNHPLFLKAAARVAAERPDVRFVCVGHGDATYLQQLQELTRTLGIENKVQWVQARNDVRAVYNALDIFCSASSTEGFPNVIGEAMACARHCVVTDVGDSKFLVGATGLTVPSDDVEALATALRETLDGSPLNLRARQRILENFTVAHLGDKTEQVLVRSLEGRNRRTAPALGRPEEAHPRADA